MAENDEKVFFSQEKIISNIFSGHLAASFDNPAKKLDEKLKMFAQSWKMIKKHTETTFFPQNVPMET